MKHPQLTEPQIRHVIKAVRLRAKLSEKALAKRCGVPPVVIKATLQRCRAKGMV